MENDQVPPESRNGEEHSRNNTHTQITLDLPKILQNFFCLLVSDLKAVVLACQTRHAILAEPPRMRLLYKSLKWKRYSDNRMRSAARARLAWKRWVRTRHYAGEAAVKLGWERTVARPTVRKVIAPPRLDLSDEGEVTLEFFRTLRHELADRNSSEMVVNLRGCNHISPECALVLAGELKCGHDAIPQKRKYCRPSNSASVNEVLQKTGFFRHFKSFPSRFAHLDNSKLTFVFYQTGTEVSGSVVGRLVEHFQVAAKWSGGEDRALYKALVECLANVLDHAYPDGLGSRGHLARNRWWLCGSRDEGTGEIWLACLDLGVGISSTIRTRLADRIPIIGGTDESLIVKAVVEGAYSRTKKPTRGRGLPALRAFIDRARTGELLIVSKRSRCKFAHCAEAVQERLSCPFEGTIVVWSLKP